MLNRISVSSRTQGVIILQARRDPVGVSLSLGSLSANVLDFDRWSGHDLVDVWKISTLVGSEPIRLIASQTARMLFAMVWQLYA